VDSRRSWTAAHWSQGCTPWCLLSGGLSGGEPRPHRVRHREERHREQYAIPALRTSSLRVPCLLPNTARASFNRCRRWRRRSYFPQGASSARRRIRSAGSRPYSPTPIAVRRTVRDADPRWCAQMGDEGEAVPPRSTHACKADPRPGQGRQPMRTRSRVCPVARLESPRAQSE
jgi:hypothetical protein